MAAVYRARDVYVNTHHAIEVLDPPGPARPRLEYDGVYASSRTRSRPMIGRRPWFYSR